MVRQGLVAAGIVLLLTPVICVAEDKPVDIRDSRLTMDLSRSNVLEDALGKAAGAKEKARVRLDLIKVLQYLAVDYSRLRRETDRIKVLYRIEAEYEELRR